MAPKGIETATLAAGCFWCTEAIFQRLKGVASVTSGYAGGNKDNPSYETVAAGTTGHAEAIQITFDPAVISFETLLDVFWKTHNPTTPNQQGNDVGTQYRSVIFYHTEEQRHVAEASRAAMEAAGTYDDAIVTEIVPYTTFYPAETDHQDFYASNPTHGYCQLVIDPKIAKLSKDFKDIVTEDTGSRSSLILG